MTKLTLTMLTAAALAGGPFVRPAAAQDSTAAPQQQAHDRLAQMKERLKLTPEQEAKVKPIVHDQMERMREIRAKYDGQQSRRARIGMVRELRDVQSSADAQLAQILDANQMAELRKMRDEMRNEMRERRQP